MRPRAEPTVEDLFATARCLCAICARRSGLDAAALARRLVARARTAQIYREVHRRAHPRFGDGSLSAASGLAQMAALSRTRERTDPLSFLAALAAVISALEGYEMRTSS